VWAIYMISVISEITKLFILTTFVSVECSTKLIDTKEFLGVM